MPNPKPVLALFPLPGFSQTNTQTRAAKSACSSSRTDIACVAEPHQDNFFQGHLIEMSGAGTSVPVPVSSPPSCTHTLIHKGPSSQQNANNVQRCSRK